MKTISSSKVTKWPYVSPFHLVLIGLLGMPHHLMADDSEPSVTLHDPHYTRAGFFDIHVCNWPNRSPFFMTLFSTKRYKELSKVEVFMPNGKPLGELNLDKYRLVTQKDKPSKRVFIKQISPPQNATDGWYRARATLNNGETIEAKDYVVIDTMARAGNMTPADGAKDIPVPKVLKWAPIVGAKYYQVFIKDLWDGGQLIYSSKLIPKPSLELPKGLLQPDGLYTWRVHARDVNEHLLLGDFNHGSLSIEAKFSTAP